MRKIYSLVLMAAALLVGTNAWATTHEVGTFAELQTALNNAVAGDVIELTADITYDGAWATVSAADLNSATTVVEALCITKSITLDGKGHKIVGWGKHDIGVGSVNGKFHGLKSATTAKTAITESSFGDVNTIHRVSLAIHPADANAAIDVVVKNISVGNETRDNRYFGIIAFDGVDELNLDNVTIKTGAYSAQQGLCFTGANATPIRLTMSNSEINVGKSAYATYFLKPFTGTISKTTIDGWAALYFKNRNIPVYGAVVGTRGSNVTCDACTFICKNVHNGESNSFAMFPLEDDGITLTLNNCSMNPEKIGDQAQSLVSLQAMTRTSGYQPVVVNITGDNTHIYSIGLAAAIKNNMAKGDGAYYDVVTGDPGAGGNGVAANVPLTINITGGTFTVNPAEIAYPQYDGATWGGTTQGVSIDLTNLEINEVSQGGSIVYRVVKKAAVNPETSTLYDLNDAVETAAEGENPVTSFELSTGGTMELDENREVTTAGYVQVKDNATEGATTVKVGTTATADPTQKVDQTLVVNNGLDVQGNSVVEVQAGSTLQIGEGGIVTSKSENIVIEADETGAASLIMDPAITVNQTPNLTVKMKASQIGKNAQGDYYWHRFAMPVDKGITGWTKEGTLDPSIANNYPTYLYGWDYVNNDWKKLTYGVADMVPLQGYTLTLASDEVGTSGITELQDVTYIFKGTLVGNTDQPINFQREGFNFFGNSYTGYIDVLTLIQGFVSNNVEGTVYMWCNDQDDDEHYQQYEGVSLYQLQHQSTHLEKWQKEVAPMQTFILRLRGANEANETVDYASAIWGNPRYGNSGSSAAPMRVATVNNEEAYFEVSVKSANGKGSRINFTQDANHNDAFESGYDVVKYMNERTINLYTTINGENLSSVVTNTINGKLLSLQTNDEMNYTMSFKNVEGNQYAILDHATNQITLIAEGNTYPFVAQPNSTLEGRFEIINVNRMPTDVETIEETPVVRGIYTITGQYVGENFETLPKGVYVVDGVKIVK